MLRKSILRFTDWHDCFGIDERLIDLTIFDTDFLSLRSSSKMTTNSILFQTVAWNYLKLKFRFNPE